MQKIILGNLFFYLFLLSPTWANQVHLSIQELGLQSKIKITGTTNVKERIFLALQLEKIRSPYYPVTPQNGKFSLELTVSKKILFGKYKVILYQAKTQQIFFSDSFSFGAEEKILQEKISVRSHVLDLYQSLCESTRRIQRGGHFFYNTLTFIKSDHPEQALKYRKMVWIYWKSYYSFLKELIQEAEQNVEEFQNSIYLNPYQEVLESFQKILKECKFLIVEYHFWIKRWISFREMKAGLPYPAKVREHNIFFQNQKIAKLLSLKSPLKITPNHLAKSFQGTVLNNTIKENKLKFELPFDPKIWKVFYIPENTNVRLKLIHKTAPSVMVYIEVFQYKKSTSYTDLKLMAVISAQERFPGFRKLSNKTSQVKINGDTKEVFQFVFITETSLLTGRQIFQNKVYQIFCEDKITVYGLRFFAPFGEFKKYTSQFDKLQNQFKVFKK